MSTEFEIALAALKKSSDEAKAINEKLDAIAGGLQHTVSNLVGAAQTDDREEIRAYSTDETGQTTVIKSKKRSMYIRNILYGNQ